MPTALRERLVHDALLEKVLLAGRRIGFLFNGSEQQRVKFRMTFLDLAANGAVVRLPVAPARQDDESSEYAAAHENWNKQRERATQDRARGEEKKGDERKRTPADGERAGPAPCALPTCHRFKLGFEQRFSHGINGVSLCCFYTAIGEKQ